MAKLKICSDWWTAPAEGDGGKLVMVTGRRNMDNVIDSKLYKVRVTMTWTYAPEDDGMPDYATSVLMDQVNEAIATEFEPDPVAINTGIYTGDGKRDWVFYTRSLSIFQRKINEALEAFDLLPLEFQAENDPEWNEYREMRETEITDGDD